MHKLASQQTYERMSVVQQLYEPYPPPVIPRNFYVDLPLEGWSLARP